MTQREKLIEMLMQSEREAENDGFFNCHKSEKKAEYIADYLFANGVAVIDTNSVKRENLPLVQQAFNMPLDELAQLVEAKQAGRIVERPCKVFDKTFLLLESDSDEYEIYESKCVRITDNGYGVYYSMAYKCPAIGNTLEFGISDFGKCVFLTREEAEKALAERCK